MPYSHYGEIGDVWKHLPLAEILSLESPTTYWESHAASGLYELPPTPNQRYGVVRYVERASSSDALRRHRPRTYSGEYWDETGVLGRYPGSPVIAMRLLDRPRSPEADALEFVFCDVEPEAVRSERSL